MSIRNRFTPLAGRTARRSWKASPTWQRAASTSTPPMIVPYVLSRAHHASSHHIQRCARECGIVPHVKHTHTHTHAATVGLARVQVEDEDIMREHITFAHPNIWPRDGDCPGLEEACKAAAGIIVRVGAVLARHTDAYVQSVDPTYTEHLLEKVITEYRTHKGRLLYYFPMNAEQAAELSNAADVSSWCGWHNDHGSLTGLTPAQFFSPEGEPIACPDPAAGLYIRSRKGETLRVPLPPDAIAYQIGEAAQVHTGGILQATPHCVRAAAEAGVGRGTLAVFMEPQWDVIMSTPAGAKAENVLRGARGELLPKGVPPLASRWEESGKQTFGEFNNKTLSMYY